MNGMRRGDHCGVPLGVFVSLLASSSTLFGAQASTPPTKPVDPPATAPKETPPPTPDAKPGDKPAEKPTAPAPPSKPEGKTLDELLGIPSSNGKAEGERKPDGAGAETKSGDGLDDAKRRLERGLSEAEVDSLLRQALAGMETSAARLTKETDSGLGTQRVQEDVVAKLDQLIEEAKRRSKQGQKSSQSSNSSSSSSSSSRSKPQSGEKSGEAEQGKVGDSKSRDGAQRGKSAEGMREGDGPPPVDPDADQAALDETQSEWGSLPERVRDLIRQGARDRVASIYQRLTQEYYRRMAEEASR